MKEIIYKTASGYVETDGNTYTVYASTVTDYDGIKAKDLREIKTFAKHYTINHLNSKVTSIYYKYDPLTSAIELLNAYTR